MCEEGYIKRDITFVTPLFPNPVSVAGEMFGNFSGQVTRRWPRDDLGDWLGDTFRTLKSYFFFEFGDLMNAVYIAICLVVLKLIFDFILLKRIPKWFKLDKESSAKFPESSWSCCIYFIGWVWDLYNIVYNRKSLFFDLSSHWKYWKPGMEVEPELYWLLMFQLGAYMHFLFTTIFVSTKRKDFSILVTHHLVTIALILWAYGVRYHYVGLLVLFLHDIGDVLLEFGKTVIYFKEMDGQKYPKIENIANGLFATFIFSWFLCRLYWFPMKVMYSTTVACVLVCSEGAFYLPFNILLFLLYCMQVYWTYFIVKLLVKVLLRGDLEDNREYDVEKRQKERKKMK